MRQFYVADLTSAGEIQLRAEYQYEQLERLPGAAELIGYFSSHIWRTPEEFEVPLLIHGVATAGVQFRWRSSAPTAGLATLRAEGILASLSVVLCGTDPQADTITLQAFQQHLLRNLHDTGIEPAFGLMDLPQRPLLATVNFAPPEQKIDRLLVAMADRCFAAAYLRYHQLA